MQPNSKDPQLGSRSVFPPGNQTVHLSFFTLCPKMQKMSEICKESGHRGTLDLAPADHFLHRLRVRVKTTALRVRTGGSAPAGPRACHGAQFPYL